MEDSSDSLERYVLINPLYYLFHTHLNGDQQAIHPAQVDIIQSAYGPTSAGRFDSSLNIVFTLKCSEILRAAKIVHQMELAHASEKGAAGLDDEMIDAPMLKQVCFKLHISATMFL